jgi:uncharacterized Fe-S cluster-containing protein
MPMPGSVAKKCLAYTRPWQCHPVVDLLVGNKRVDGQQEKGYKQCPSYPLALVRKQIVCFHNCFFFEVELNGCKYKLRFTKSKVNTTKIQLNLT